MIKRICGLLLVLASASFFYASAALAQNQGTITNHAFAIGKGPGTTGYTSLLCGSAQLAVGQSAADPICRTITGDVTIDASGVTAIGTAKVTSAMLRNSAALSVIGRSANSIGVPGDISCAAASDAVLRESGSVLGCGTIATAGIANNAVTFAKIQQIAGLSIVGNSGTSTANTGALTGTADQVMRIAAAGASAGFGSIDISKSAAVGASLLALTNGGCNAALTASNGGILWSNASQCQILAGTATARLPLLSGATAAPVWGAFTLPASVTSGGIPYFSSTSAMASSGALTANALILGGGAGASPTALGSLGTTTTVLHGNAAGAPTFGAIVAADVTANTLTNATLATMAAYTIKANATGSAAAPTDVSIPALTQKAAPVATDKIMIADSAASDALKYATVSSLASAGSVASIAGNTGAFTLGIGLTNSVNDLRVSLTTASNALGADVTMVTINTYQDGPSMAQGTSGTWWASGHATLLDTTATARYDCKLWDGTTVIDSGSVVAGGTGFHTQIALAGILSSPAANIRISCKDQNTGVGKMLFNASGASKDSTVSGFRIQ